MCGVPQGSVLGPQFYILYTGGIISIVEQFGFIAHLYADDLQIYAHVSPSDASSLITRFSDCMDAVKRWMEVNRLCLNPAKTEIIWLGSSRNLQLCSSIPLLISGVLIKPSTKVKNLGVMFDSDLSMTTHINKLLSACFFHIRQLRLIRRSLDEDATHALVRALIHSRLDYCNGVLTGLSIDRLKRLQSVLKASARLVLRLPSHASVTDLMINRLHWLGFPQRITYKLCVLAYKSLRGNAPAYMLRHFIPVASVAGRAQLRSASSGQLVVPFTRTVVMGGRNFAYRAPLAWNNLPPGLRNTSLSLDTFRRHLKTFLFKLHTPF